MNKAYPSLEAVEQATHIDLARWFRFLPSPNGEAEAKALDRIIARLQTLGGIDPQISKAIGWGEE